MIAVPESEVVRLLRDLISAQLSKVYERSEAIFTDAAAVVRRAQERAEKLNLVWDEWAELTSYDYLIEDEETMP